MKKIVGIIFSIFFLVMMAGCTQKTDITATFYDVDVAQTSIVLSINIDDPNAQITGVITIKLVRPDGAVANLKEITDPAEYTNIVFSSLDNALKYTIEVYATVGRNSILIGSQTYTLLTASTIHITTPEQFLQMNTNRSGTYVLDNDLDFSDISFVSPFSSSFSGSFDGQGYTIRNVNYSAIVTYTGLFGYVSSGTIKNLNIDNMTIGTEESPLLMSTSTRAGFLAGYVSSSTASFDNITISNSTMYFSSASTIQAFVGGVAGEFKGTMTNITLENSSITLTETSYGKVKLGGAVGLLADDATMNKINADTDLTFYMAGIILKDRDISINIGGIIGDNHAINGINPVTEVASTGDIHVNLDFGTAPDTTSARYAVYVGGLVGFSSTNINNAFYSGSITLNHEKNDNESNVIKSFFVGGLIGYFGSQSKVNQSVMRYGDLQTITINVSDDVTLKASQTIGGTNSSVEQNVGIIGDKSLDINSVSMVDSDPSTVYTTITDFFTSDWIQTVFDGAVIPKNE